MKLTEAQQRTLDAVKAVTIDQRLNGGPVLSYDINRKRGWAMSQSRTVTALTRLSDMGLISYDPKIGYVVTDAGRAQPVDCIVRAQKKLAERRAAETKARARLTKAIDSWQGSQQDEDREADYLANCASAMGSLIRQVAYDRNELAQLVERWDDFAPQEDNR
jgi:hypothetical protein